MSDTARWHLPVGDGAAVPATGRNLGADLEAIPTNSDVAAPFEGSMARYVADRTAVASC